MKPYQIILLCLFTMLAGAFIGNSHPQHALTSGLGFKVNTRLAVTPTPPVSIRKQAEDIAYEEDLKAIKVIIQAERSKAASYHLHGMLMEERNAMMKADRLEGFIKDLKPAK